MPCKLITNGSLLLALSIIGIQSIGFTQLSQAQTFPQSLPQIIAPIIPDQTTATEVQGNAVNPIGAGTVNQGNLFHSFDRFNVPASGVVFGVGNSTVNGASIRNIINRVTGITPSAILGLIQSRQAFPNANFYLLNPNGLVFGANASLDLGGSFHATTGTALGFEREQIFRSDRSLTFPDGDPQNIQFGVTQPAGLINQGNLSVTANPNLATPNSITLTGNPIINTGTIKAPNNSVSLLTVPGNSKVELRSPNAVLGLSIAPEYIATNWSGAITDLPKLAAMLTGLGIAEANQVILRDGLLALVNGVLPTGAANGEMAQEIQKVVNQVLSALPAPEVFLPNSTQSLNQLITPQLSAPALQPIANLGNSILLPNGGGIQGVPPIAAPPSSVMFNPQNFQGLPEGLPDRPQNFPNPPKPPDPPQEPPKLPQQPSEAQAAAIAAVAKNAIAGASEFKQSQASQFLRQGLISQAFAALERGGISELEAFTGRALHVTSLDLGSSQQELLTVSKQTKSSSALIYPVILEDRLEILVIPPTGQPFRRYVNEAAKKVIEPVIKDFRDSLRDTGSTDYLLQAQQLYDWLIRPIEPELQAAKIQTLVFVMDGDLRVIPVAALHDGKQFLVEKYASATIPTLRLTNLEDRDRNNNRILAMGLSEAVQGFAALPAAQAEISSISQILPGNAFINEPFTIENLQAQRRNQNYGIIHLATHAEFLSNAADGAFIQFWNSRLKLNQIPALKLNNPPVEILTLSACQTAVGKNLGLSGLALQSGAKSVLASLWQVSDVGTAPLMLSFYSLLQASPSKAIALQTAQRSLIQGTVKVEHGKIIGIPGLSSVPIPETTSSLSLSHPFYWSSFILVGNWL